jgi:hypothetical protein
MKILKQSLFVALIMFLWISVAAADEKSGQAATPGPTMVSQAKYSLTVGSGEYAGFQIDSPPHFQNHSPPCTPACVTG